MTPNTIQQTPKIFPWHGWLGLIILTLAESLLLLGNTFIATWLTPIMWTGYILLIDALVYKLQRKSFLTSQLREAPFLILTSVLVWLLFEAYNFHLKNWQYLGLPSNLLIRELGFFWSFATIMPGVFETADLIQAIFASDSQDEPQAAKPHFYTNLDWIWITVGILLVIIPLILPEEIAAYLFVMIWIGFIPLLYPIIKRLDLPTSFMRWNTQMRNHVLHLLLAGLVCGFLWETWNYQAFNAQGAYWVYTIPQQLRPLGWHFGKMPVLGLLGFPPFAIELYLFYQLLKKVTGVERFLDSKNV